MNEQKPMPVQRCEDGLLLVHSVFETIQGEGPFAGKAAIFIRLNGCNLQCPFCDTEYTRLGSRHSPVEIVNRLTFMHHWYTGLIVITGGEPFRQNITPLVRRLFRYNFTVQIETNGVLYPGDDFPWDHVTVVCSPKTGKIHPETARRVHAYKYVLSHDSIAPDGLPISALGHPLGGFSTVARPPVGWVGPVYVQPMDALDEAENKANLLAVAHSVEQHHNYIMGVQLHKLIGYQ